MSKNIAIHLSNVGKMYRIFSSRKDNLLDALGLAKLMPWLPVSYREFWAVRGIDINLEVGRRIGIIGRNGAGKTTLLKLICGNLPQTEGEIKVQGTIQALLSVGAGFHPEFTGYENIKASLTYQGMSNRQIEASIEDIAEFTELGQFLSQPFKNYSAGMQARLNFATATVINPNILIVDEILGAGDAYFAGKSMERMKQLVEDSGATVLIVSHALDQILRYCEECIWLERGRMIQRGPALEVVKAYEQFIRVLEERRLKAKNYKRSSSKYSSDRYDIYGDNLVVRFIFQGQPGDYCDISTIKFLNNEDVEEELRVGDTQDIDTTQSAFVILDSGNWSKPQNSAHTFFRRLGINGKDSSSGTNQVSGQAVFYTFALFKDAKYGIELNYRCSGNGVLNVEFVKNGVLQDLVSPPMGSSSWTTYFIPLDIFEPSLPILNNFEPVSSDESVSLSPSEVAGEVPQSDEDVPLSTGEVTGEVLQSDEAGVTLPKESESLDNIKPGTFRRWPGEGSLMIEQVLLLDSMGKERNTFQVDSRMTVEAKFIARSSNTFRVIPVAVLFRIDGIMVSQHIGEPVNLELKKGEKRVASMDFGNLGLGDGNYVFSIALYRELDFANIEKPEIYDLIDRSIEFSVYGNYPLLTALVHHPAKWRVS